MKARKRKPILQAALSYAKKEWPVFPIRQNKIPYIKDWPNKASTNQTTIKHWWRQWPNANIALVCGERSGLVVIDIDVKKLPSELKRLACSMTAKVRTTKGTHYYFQAPDEPLRTRQFDNFELKAEGSNITAPPSLHESGRRYKWIREIKPKPLPDWLLELVKKKKKPKLKFNGTIPEGKRHNTLLAMAGKYRNLGYGYRKLLALLEIDNESCDPPQSLDDVKRIARDIAGKPLTDDEFIVLSADELEPKILEWLWPDRIPFGCTTTFFGLGGKVKSTTSIDIAAIISVGGFWPNLRTMKAPIGSTLYVGQEDPYEEVIIPRFLAMGGNPEKLKFFEGIKRAKSPNPEYLDWIDLSRDLPILEKWIKKMKDLKLIIFDPLTGTLGKKTDSFKSEDVRRVVGPLTKLAQKYEIAIILIQHSNKNTQGDALHQISGTAEFGNLTRQVWMFGSDFKNERRFLMVPVKRNYGLPPTGLAFKVEQTDPANVCSVKLIFEITPIQESAKELWGQRNRGRPPNELERAINFYEKVLVSGPALREEADKHRKAQKISDRTDLRVRNLLGIRKVEPKTGKFAGKKVYKSAKIQMRKI